MYNIKLEEIKIKDFKKINELSINISDKTTCFIGPNASGKSTILEAISGENPRYLYGVYPDESIYKLKMNVKSIEELNIHGIVYINVYVLRYKDGGSQIIDIEGLEAYTMEKEKALKESRFNYDKVIRKIYGFLLEIKSRVGKIDLSKLNQSEHYKIMDLPVEKIDKTISYFEKYLNSEFNAINLLQSNLHIDYLEFDFRLNYKVFDLSFIDENRYKQFKEYYSRFTKKANGKEFDIKGADEMFYRLKDEFKLLEEFMSLKNKESYRLEESAKKAEDEFHDIKNSVYKVAELIRSNIYNYLNNTLYISSSEFDRHFKLDQLSKKEINNIRLIHPNILDKELDKLSDGEKWIANMVHEINERKGGLLFIDEPGMFLNPQIQRRILDYFKKLNNEGFQIIYSTHSEILIPLDNKSITYVTSLDEHISIDLAKMAELEGNSEIVIGDLIVKLAADVILVEGENDQQLFEYVLKDIDSRKYSKYIIYDCKGNGILQAISLCMKIGINFHAFVDLDKERYLRRELGELHDRFEDQIYYIGTESFKEIEGWMEQSDYDNFCVYLEDKQKYKMYYPKLKEFIKSKGNISDKLKQHIENMLKDMKL